MKNMHIIILFIALSALWLVNSGIYTGLILSLGLFSVCFVIWLTLRMGILDHESRVLYSSPKLPAYYLWLGKKITQSNIDVLKHIWQGPNSISPCVATLSSAKKGEISKVIYANSITLTPGTVAMDLDGDDILVHSLTTSGIEELRQGEMSQRIDQLELK